MGRSEQRVAVITVHGVADQRPGQTVRELARLLGHGGDGTPRYVAGELCDIIVPVGPLQALQDSRRSPPDPAAAASGVAARTAPEPAETPGQPSDFHLARRGAATAGATPPVEDLDLALTDHLLSRYRPAERDGLYESTRIALRRQPGDTPVDLYELYWADFSRLQPGGIRILSASYQLLFHLSTLARDIVDHVAMATGRGGTLRALQWLHAWSAWLLKGPALLLQLTMLLLVAFGAAALVPPAQYRFLLGLGGALAAVVLGILAMLAVQHARGTSRTRAALPWAGGALAGAAIAALAIAVPNRIVDLYIAIAILLFAVVGVLVVQYYGRAVRGVQVFGNAAVVTATGLLAFNVTRTLPQVSTIYEWIIISALNTGEYLLSALLLAWAILALMQIAVLTLGFALVRRDDHEVAASLVSARVGMVISTAIFALLSIVLWSVIAYLTGLGLDELSFSPAVFGDGYYDAALFIEAQVQDVGSLFTPLLALVGLIGVLALVALAPCVREELAPGRDARSQEWTARLGRWWTAARSALRILFGTVIPMLALGGGVVYLLFLMEKLFGLHGPLAWLGTRDEVLVAVGKWLAGGAVTISALGTRFTQTFGKLRVALDAVLDIDNYFLDPADRLPPRARIFSRFAALLDYVRVRGYARVVIVAHSQGTVISADLLRYLHLTHRLRAVAGNVPITLVTVGSPLRDLYAGCFPLLYRWLGTAPSSFADALPPAAELGLVRWVNAYRSGDYVGRSIWTPPTAASMFRVAAVDDAGAVNASRAGDRAEFCLGAGAHTHYFSDDALALAAEIDRAICDEPVDLNQRPG
jgi:hypothetical protein